MENAKQLVEPSNRSINFIDKKKILYPSQLSIFHKVVFHSFLDLIWEGLSQWFAFQQCDVSGVSLTGPVKVNRNIFAVVDL